MRRAQSLTTAGCADGNSVGHQLFCFHEVPSYVSAPIRETKMKKSLLSAIVGLATLALMQGADTPTQPAAGTAAPDFSLATSDGSQISLKDYKGKWVVLYFYPKDFTSGCTIEAKNFQRDLDQYTKTGAVVLGVSVDNAQSHKEFCAKEGLNFKLLADPDGKVSAQYGSTMQYQGATMAARNTFLINPEGKIAKVYTSVKPAEHSEQVLKDLAELKKS
jgi:peroxiredoxin Q/BCP